MSKQRNSGKYDGTNNASMSNGSSPRAGAQSNRSDAATKPGTTPSKAAVRIDNGGSLSRPNVGPAGSPYYESPGRKDYF